jgi:hypothetical protein
MVPRICHLHSKPTFQNQQPGPDVPCKSKALFERITINITGFFTESDSRNQHLPTAMVYFTKCPRCTPFLATGINHCRCPSDQHLLPVQGFKRVAQ